MSEAWLNLPTSAGEKCITLLKVSRRRSRAMEQAVRDATAPVRMVATSDTRHSPNIVVAMRLRYAFCTSAGSMPCALYSSCT